MKVLAWFSTFGLGASIGGALFLLFDVSFIDHKWSWNQVITLALISIASSGLWLILNEQEKNERSK